MWGLSPALDLIKEVKRATTLEKTTEVNILLVGSVDARHILKTLAKLYFHEVNIKVNFYVLDLLMELVARQMLLLTIALEPSDRLGLIEKSRLWMEVFGNTLMRPTSAKYVMHKAAQLVHMVTNREFQRKRMPLLNLEHLKYKEIDQLENIFKYWEENKMHISKVWDWKLRCAHKTRYDSKIGVFDWDYNMKLRSIPGGERLNGGEYKQWRNTGVAFTWLETEYSVANPTLAVGVSPEGDQLLSMGYMGDMESGPFFSFGLDCEEESFLKTVNGVNVKRATDITQRHLERIFSEVEHCAQYDAPEREELQMGLVVTGLSNLDLDAEVNIRYEPDKTPEDYSPVHLDHQVTFLPSNALETCPKKDKFKKFFHLIYFGQNYFQFFHKDLLEMANSECPIIVETRKFAIVYSKESRELFGNEVKSKMKETGCEEMWNCDFSRESYAMFQMNDS